MKTIIYLLLLLTSVNAMAQQVISDSSINDRIRNEEKLKDLLLEVLQKVELATKQNNEAVAAICYFHIAAIHDKIYEDSSFFSKNSFIDSLIYSPTSNKHLKGAMYILKADRLFQYKRRYSDLPKAAAFKNKDGSNYKKFTQIDFANKINLYYDSARILLKDVIQFEHWLWLADHTSILHFKPNIQDIIFCRQLLECSEKKQYYNNNFKNNFNIPDSSFWSIALKEPSPLLQFSILNKWVTQYKENTEATQYLTAYARIAAYNNDYSYNRVVGDSTYANYITKLRSSKHASIRVLGVKNMFEYYAMQGAHYNITNNYYNDLQQFNTLYKYGFINAIHLFKKESLLLDSFPLLKKQLTYKINEIESKSLDIKIKTDHLPNEPIALYVYYKNVSNYYYKIFDNKKKFTDTNCLVYDSIALIDKQDYLKHATVLKINGLTEGEYSIYFSHDNFSTLNTINKATFTVTQIMTAVNNNRIYTLHRKTGMPIEHVKIEFFFTGNEKKSNKSLSIQYTNKNGYIDLPENSYMMEVIYENTHKTIYHDKKNDYVNYEDKKENQVYDKEEFDDYEDYYEDHLESYTNTDRAIYRPGQKVYFKSVILTKHIKTGKPILFTKNNIGKKIFNSILSDNNGKISAILTNPFYNKIDSALLEVNEFGSIAGSFILPKDAATGNYTISINDEDKVDIKVEEYKRPTMEISVEKPNKYLILKDSFGFTIKVKTYAGAPLQHIAVAYTVDRHISGNNTLTTNIKLLDTIGYTNYKGELYIPINDSLLQLTTIDNTQRTTAIYDIDVTATDATGESVETTGRVDVDNWPIRIQQNLPKIVDLSYDSVIKITTKKTQTEDYKGKMVIRFFKQPEPEIDTIENLGEIDVEQYSVSQWQQWFPNKTYKTASIIQNTILNKELDNAVIIDTISTEGFYRYNFPTKHLAYGKYKVTFEAIENGNIIGMATKQLTILNTKAQTLPYASTWFTHTPIQSINNNIPLKQFTGSSLNNIYVICHSTYYVKKGNKRELNHDYKHTIYDTNKLIETNFSFSKNIVGNAEISYTYVYNNIMYTDHKTIYKPTIQHALPEIEVVRYKNKTSPNAKEQFEVSVKLNNKHAQAELLSTMFDASLETLEKYNILTKLNKTTYEPNASTSWQQYYNNWNRNYALSEMENMVFKINATPLTPINTGKPKKEVYKSIWWEKPATVYANEFNKYSDVIVIGYGTQRKSDVTGSVSSVYANQILMGRAAGVNIINNGQPGSGTTIRLRGTNSVSSANLPLYIINGVPQQAIAGDIDISDITEVLILKDVQATALYGSRAINGAIIISTKGPIVLLEIKNEEPLAPPVIRSNFSETAHFLPQLHADKNGMYHIDFTMPESVTRWKWIMMAHTKDAEMTTKSLDIISQLPLMVQPSMPRYLYQGDSLYLKTRITNMDSISLKGNMIYTIEDLITGEDVTNVFIRKKLSPILIPNNNNITETALLTVPINWEHPVKIKVAVSTNTYTDGEAYDIPIYTKQRFLSTTTSYTINANEVTQVTLPKLDSHARHVGYGATINPLNNAQLVYALPSITNYSYNCAEQTTNKLYAYLVAKKLLAIDTNIYNAYNKYKKNEHQDSNPMLPSSQQMPWAQLNKKTSIQNANLYNLFNNIEQKETFTNLVNRLKQLQHQNGGIKWFDGGESNMYMSIYVLDKLGIIFTSKNALDSLTNKSFLAVPTLVERLVKYLDGNINIYKSHYIAFLKARSYWLKDYKPDSTIATWIAHQIDSIATFDKKQSLLQKASTIEMLEQYAPTNRKLYSIINNQKNNIGQLAITDENGTRWKQISNEDFLNYTTEESIALLCNIFNNDSSMLTGITKWLFTFKKDNAWHNTKATSAVIQSLLLNTKHNQTPPTEVSININKESFSLKNELLTESLYHYTNTSGIANIVNITNASKYNSSGNITQYYFGTNIPTNETVQIEKILFYKNSNNVWDTITSNTVLSIGTIIKAKHIIHTTKPLQFVFIDDKKPAAFEYVETESGYTYGKHFSFYKSIRDGALEIFADHIPLGSSYIEYEMKVAKEGSYNTGISSLQCLYTQGIEAYTKQQKITVKQSADTKN